MLFLFPGIYGDYLIFIFPFNVICFIIRIFFIDFFFNVFDNIFTIYLYYQFFKSIRVVK